MARIDCTCIPFSSLSHMSQRTFITAAQKANVGRGHEGLDVALRNDNPSAWIAFDSVSDDKDQDTTFKHIVRMAGYSRFGFSKTQIVLSQEEPRGF